MSTIIDERALFDALRAEGHAVEFHPKYGVAWPDRRIVIGAMTEIHPANVWADGGVYVGEASTIADVVRLLAPYAPPKRRAPKGLHQKFNVTRTDGQSAGVLSRVAGGVASIPAIPLDAEHERRVEDYIREHRSAVVDEEALCEALRLEGHEVALSERGGPVEPGVCCWADTLSVTREARWPTPVHLPLRVRREWGLIYAREGADVPVGPDDIDAYADSTQQGVAHSIADVVRLLAPYRPQTAVAESVAVTVAESDADVLARAFDVTATGGVFGDEEVPLTSRPVAVFDHEVPGMGRVVGKPLDHVRGAVRVMDRWVATNDGPIEGWNDGRGQHDGREVDGVFVKLKNTKARFEPGITAEDFARRYGAAMGGDV